MYYNKNVQGIRYSDTTVSAKKFQAVLSYCNMVQSFLKRMIKTEWGKGIHQQTVQEDDEEDPTVRRSSTWNWLRWPRCWCRVEWHFLDGCVCFACIVRAYFALTVCTLPLYAAALADRPLLCATLARRKIFACLLLAACFALLFDFSAVLPRFQQP